MASEGPVCLPWQGHVWDMEQTFQWKSSREKENWKSLVSKQSGALSWPALLDMTSDSTNQYLGG